jgi:uncharacterized protein (TIGR03435 family)
MKLLALVVFLAVADSPTFDVASIKVSTMVSDGIGGTYGFRPGGSVSVRNVTLRDLMELAYSLESYRLIGGPAWMSVQRYHVDAKPPGRVGNKEAQLMLQALLVDRFKLQVHRESRTVDGYVLTAPKGDAKLPALAPDAQIGFRRMGNGEVKGPGTMGMLARLLKAQLGVPVDDQTGLTGKYQMSLDYSPDEAVGDARPSIFAALQEQLGLTLKRQKVPVEVLVVDRAEKAAGN